MNRYRLDPEPPLTPSPNKKVVYAFQLLGEKKYLPKLSRKSTAF